MSRNRYSEKVRSVRDTIIDTIQELSEDKENLIPNIKIIKELTTILKEMDRIEERDDKSESSTEELNTFYSDITKRASINTINKQKEK